MMLPWNTSGADARFSGGAEGVRSIPARTNGWPTMNRIAGIVISILASVLLSGTGVYSELF